MVGLVRLYVRAAKILRMAVRGKVLSRSLDFARQAIYARSKLTERKHIGRDFGHITPLRGSSQSSTRSGTAEINAAGQYAKSRRGFSAAAFFSSLVKRNFRP